MSVQAPIPVDLSKYIATDLFGERPHIRGRRIPVATIAYSARSHGWTNEELAHQFDLNESEVLAALLYYTEYQTEIDALEAKYQNELDDAFASFGKND